MPDSKNIDLVSFYVNAATRENTVRSYRTAIEHYERHWGDSYLPLQLRLHSISVTTLIS